MIAGTIDLDQNDNGFAADAILKRMVVVTLVLNSLGGHCICIELLSIWEAASASQLALLTETKYPRLCPREGGIIGIALPSVAVVPISTPIPHADCAALLEGPPPVASRSCRSERSITIRGGQNRRTTNHGLA